MVTMSEVAARAGVSQATVSYVLGGQADLAKISEQTRDRVLSAARDLGYQRNLLARAMITGKSRILGVLTKSDSRENLVRILAGAVEAASSQDYLLKVIHLSLDGVDDSAIARCLEWRLAGAMAIGLERDSFQRVDQELGSRNIALAMVDDSPSVKWGARIFSDDNQGLRQVIGHLTELGHRKIAFLGGEMGDLSSRREQIFRDAIKDAKLDIPAVWIRNSSWHNRNIIESVVREILANAPGERPTAVVCSADNIAMVVQRVARSLQLSVPEDLSVTGYSDSSLSEFTDPALTTVDQSFFEMGRAAALYLIGSNEGGREDANAAVPDLLIPTRLVIRESTGSARQPK